MFRYLENRNNFDNPKFSENFQIMPKKKNLLSNFSFICVVVFYDHTSFIHLS